MFFKIKIILGFAFLVLLLPSVCIATENSFTRTNNPFGIHLAVPNEEDLKKAAELVNSQGGDWGYVTLIIEESDRKLNKWQSIFDQLRELHLIPIIRLATGFDGENWKKPQSSEAKSWVIFLDSLHWVVKDRHIVLFNEPNHAQEWGGEIDPEGYGEIVLEFAQRLKETNEDFLVMLSGFDAAAPSKLPKHEDEAVFLKKMLGALEAEEKNLFDLIDGWASHAYPNYGFVGSPDDNGRHSIVGYQWELDLLKRLGIVKKLPVFITETGWPHQEGLTDQPGYHSAEKVAGLFRSYFDRITKDKQVQAITPFVLNYQGEPFDHFSWLTLKEKDVFPQFEIVKNLPKIKGDPIQEEKLVATPPLPGKLIRNSTYQFEFQLRNAGQAIWEPKTYELTVGGLPQDSQYFWADFLPLKPFEEKKVRLHLKTGDQTGKLPLTLRMVKEGKVRSNLIKWPVEIFGYPSITFKTSLWPKRKTAGNDFKLVIYNQKEEVVFEALDIGVKDSRGKVEEIRNLTLNHPYRVVILKPYYLPRQDLMTITKKENSIYFKPSLPVDFNQDGRFSLGDLLILITKPKLLSLWWFN
ncbi:MAG: hypothetical protein JW991_00375 [Candidatus Pacebacteria bacterium]|nr:hypothetical protein [Candidatus Paceibacterota bacterium]